MYKFEFAEDDIFVNRLKTYPEYNIFIYQEMQYTNKETNLVDKGGLIVYDIERDPNPRPPRFGRPRISSSVGFRQDFKSNLTNPLVDSFSGFNGYQMGPNQPFGNAGLFRFKQFNQAQVGPITGSYARSVPIERRLTRKIENQVIRAFDLTQTSQQNFNLYLGVNPTASALLTAASKYTTLSPHFILEGNQGPITASLGLGMAGVPQTAKLPAGIPSRNLLGEQINFIFIPQIYYGTTIKKGSVNLKYILTGSQVAQCSDLNHNGELIELTGTVASGNRVTGSVVGIVFYDEGIIALTASHNLETGPPLNIVYEPDEYNIVTKGTGVTKSSSWLYYGTTLNDGTGSSNTLASASYELNFKGVSYVNTMTAFAHAPRGHLNHSNNPTYRNYTSSLNSQTGSGNIYYQGTSGIQNIVTASHTSASFEKTTYISKINIYDENNNLIGVTTMANPVKKLENRDYTFKIKFDI